MDRYAAEIAKRFDALASDNRVHIQTVLDCRARGVQWADPRVFRDELRAEVITHLNQGRRMPFARPERAA